MDSRRILTELNIIEDSVVLYVNKPHALVNGVKTYISQDREIVPFMEGDIVYIPVRFCIESFHVSDKECEYIDKGICGSVKRNGVTYAPVQEVCKMLSYHLFSEAGLLIISKQTLKISWESNLKEMRQLCESFIYEDVTGSRIVELVKERYPDCGHPRMIMTKERFEMLREEYRKGDQGEPVYAALFRTLQKECDEILLTEPADYELRAGIRLIYVSDTVLTRSITLALMYQITGYEPYAVRARAEMLNACGFKDWHPYHFLDTGIMVCGLGLAYDWLYDWLSESDRKIIRSAIVEKGIAQIMNDYDYKTIICEDQENPLSRTCFWNHGNGGNWVFASGAGVAVGALAVCDELTGRELAMAERSLSQALLDMRPAISQFAPDGGYEEGVGYWNFSSVYWQRYVGSLMTATGSDFGYTDAPGLRQTNAFLYAVFGPAAKYGYHDVKIKNTDVPSGALFWAWRFHNYEEAQPRIQAILEGRGDFHDLLFYDPVLAYNEESENGRKSDGGTLDYLSVNSGIFASRSGWAQDDFWVALHADEGIIKGCHRHSDGGSFALQAMGEEFFFDLGSDDYNLPNYRKTSYRCRAEGHNVVLINPGQGQYGEYDMQFAGRSKIDRWKSENVFSEKTFSENTFSENTFSYAQADVTDLWREDLESGRRGVKLYKKAGIVILQDELIMKKASEIYWFAHTRAEIEICEDGKTAMLTRNGKTLYAKIISGDDALFSVMEAKPLPTSPACIGQNENEGVTKLTIHRQNVQNLELVVAFSAEDIRMKDMEEYVIPLAEW